MATVVLAKIIPHGFPGAGERSSFYARYACARSAGSDLLTQNPAVIPCTTVLGMG